MRKLVVLSLSDLITKTSRSIWPHCIDTYKQIPDIDMVITSIICHIVKVIPSAYVITLRSLRQRLNISIHVT